MRSIIASSPNPDAIWNELSPEAQENIRTDEEVDTLDIVPFAIQNRFAIFGFSGENRSGCPGRATTVTATECSFRRGEPFMTRLFTGVAKPKLTRLGEELGGEIEAVGKDIQHFKKGDHVFGTAEPGFDANAEYCQFQMTG